MNKKLSQRDRAGIVLRFIREDGGQDLIEYALLGALIGVCAVTAWINIPTKIKAAYISWDSNVQTLSSCTKDPIVAGGGTIGC
jgi:Flp pilus assembly pilin Flp